MTLPAGATQAAEAGTRGAPPPDNAWSNDRWPYREGATDYFSFGWYFPSNWQGATTYKANSGIAQLGFNGLANTTIQLCAERSSLQLTLLTGKVSYPGEGTFPNIGTSTLTPGTQTYEYNNTSALGAYYNAHRAIPESRWMLDVWHELIIAVTWSAGNAGRVTVWHKRKGVDSGWTQTLDLQSVPTVSWGHAATGTTNAGNYMDRNGLDRYGNRWMFINKVGPYFGEASWPRTLYLDQFAISTDLTSAKAVLE
jgi:hypothetical protein